MAQNSSDYVQQAEAKPTYDRCFASLLYIIDYCALQTLCIAPHNVCHEEGKLIGLPLNRKLEDYDIIAGTFIICGLGEEDFDSLTPELAEKYREKFADPEIFMKMGNRIVAIPIKPKDELHVAKPKQKSTEPEL